MAGKSKKHYLLSIVNKIITIPLMFSLLRHVFHLIKVEMVQAKNSIARLIFLMLCLFILLLTVWGCLLALVYLYLQSLHLTAASCVAIMLGLTLVMFVIVIASLKRSEKRLFFPETTKVIHNLFD